MRDSALPLKFNKSEGELTDQGVGNFTYTGTSIHTNVSRCLRVYACVHVCVCLCKRMETYVAAVLSDLDCSLV